MLIDKTVLEAKREEYKNLVVQHNNTVIALQGAIEALNELLGMLEKQPDQPQDAMTVDDFARKLGARSVEVIPNES